AEPAGQCVPRQSLGTRRGRSATRDVSPPVRRQRDQVEVAAGPLRIVGGERAALFAATVVAAVGAGAPDDALARLDGADVFDLLPWRDTVAEWLAAVRVDRQHREIAWDQGVEARRGLAFLHLVQTQGDCQAMRLDA